MSNIYGIIFKDGKAVKVEELNNIHHSLNYWKPDSENQLIHENLGFGYLNLYTTPESRFEVLPFYDQNANLIINADARIDNREELINKLKITKVKKIITDSQLILEAYKKYDINCPAYLVGAFSFAIWDIFKQQLFCARDHIGFKPFYYYNDSRRFIFASEIRGIKANNEITFNINETFIFDALASLRSEKDQTFYKEIHRLPPAHYMLVSKDQFRITRYWKLDPTRKIKYF